MTFGNCLDREYRGYNLRVSSHDLPLNDVSVEELSLTGPKHPQLRVY